MNRTIKFRAWDKQNEEMLGWDRDSLRDASLCSLNNEDYEFMQFTGLKDSNGKEIFEGDVVENRKQHNDKRFIIEYRIDSEYVGFVPVEIGSKGISHFISWNGMEVVGNKFENPELLTK